jgi:hypothetical protein
MELEETREPVYKLTLELANGVIDKLDIFIDSNPEELAFNFSKQKNLDFTAMNYLLEEIKKLMKRLPGFGSDIQTKQSSYNLEEELSPVKQTIQPENSFQPISAAQSDTLSQILIEQIRQEASQYEAKPPRRNDGINYGERLYQKGLKMRQLQKINREQRNKETSFSTTVPKISRDNTYYVYCINLSIQPLRNMSRI